MHSNIAYLQAGIDLKEEELLGDAVHQELHGTELWRTGHMKLKRNNECQWINKKQQLSAPLEVAASVQ